MITSNFIPKVNQDGYIPQTPQLFNKEKKNTKAEFHVVRITKIRNDESFVGVLMGSSCKIYSPELYKGKGYTDRKRDTVRQIVLSQSKTIRKGRGKTKGQRTFHLPPPVITRSWAPKHNFPSYKYASTMHTKSTCVKMTW